MSQSRHVTADYSFFSAHSAQGGGHVWGGGVTCSWNTGGRARFGRKIAHRRVNSCVEEYLFPEVGRQHQGMDRPGVHRVTEASGKEGTMEETGCEISCGAPTTLAVKEYMTMTSMGEIFSFLAISKLMPVERVF